jgi:tetratricopeptide (TPR) repeat protein
MDQDLAVTSGAPLRAARLLAQMRAGGVAELDALAFWLDRLPGEGERMWLGTQIDKIGGSTIAELEAAARDGDKSIEWRDYAVSELVKRVEQDASLREQVIDLIRDLLNREDQDQAEEETLNGFLIASALDLDAREILPDLEKAFDEDRVDPTIVDRYGIYEELELTAPEQPAPRTDGFNLRLECANCGRTRYHFTKYVIFDQTQLPERVEGREMMVMDHEIACPKCGAKDQYKVPAFERIQIMDLKPEQFMKMMTGQIPDEPPRYPPNVYFLQATAFGQPMHVLDAIDEYRRRITRNPKNADLHRRLGNIMRTIGRYPESLEHYRRAVELDGEDLELMISAASAEHDYGDLEAAERLYLRTIEVGKSNRDLLSGLSSEEVAAAQGLDFLRKGKRSIWEYQIINRQGKKLLPPARPGMETDMKKDKRPHRHGKKR